MTVYAVAGRSFDTADRYVVDGYPGVAFLIVELHRVYDYDEHEFVETGFLLMRMVGDDRAHVIDPDDVTPIEEDAFCHTCGSTGCHWHRD